MENTNKQTLTKEELAHYLIKFLRICRVEVYRDMKGLGINDLREYAAFLLVDHYLQKKESEKSTAAAFSKN